MQNYKNIIEEKFDTIKTVAYLDDALMKILHQIIEALDCGSIKVAEKIADTWIVHDWIKKAILMYIKFNKNFLFKSDIVNYFDKIPLKFNNYSEENFINNLIRVVPQTIVRKGAYIGKNSVLMPSFINIGAHIGENSMIDTWATVGSCAQIGNNVHISGGAGIGGVLEPLQANPTIIEDNCFIGARSEIVEGVIVGKGSVISMGVFIGQSTKIYDKETGKILYGQIPPYSVVIPGNLPSNDNNYSTYAAIIIKKVDENTRKKVAINDLLRN